MQKTIFITGAAQGIGRTTALMFAARGWFVGLFDVNKEGLEILAEQIGKENCCYIAMDVTEPESVKAAVELFIFRTRGRFDVLFNNAGIVEVGDFETINIEVHRRIVEVNFLGVVNCITFALPYLKENKSGAKIINMSSASAIYGNPEISVYAATKSAIKSLTEGLNIALEKYNIKVCDILPIYVKTNMVRDYYQKYRNVKLEKVKLTAEDVAETVWKAAHKNRLHWLVGTDTKLFFFLAKLLPTSIVKMMTKKILKYE
ncbi:SDR family oxidoreductase [Thermoflexibacter ruber]|uniref:NADP-dependent 3-hydroxy acid dehydrogenase YdfG n=1 Tax=Thermoflexibacter ruber TaxID=1003 RepID=A0A1I2EVH7_9BACT|nr:SDR family oxidoreductase [Thermoflexibacter ruber]SFE97082.1 NADP-dependent 3-hydroxy acid dehydrogenase YdfG [Thermoflexibacter ruber]